MWHDGDETCGAQGVYDDKVFMVLFCRSFGREG